MSNTQALLMVALFYTVPLLASANIEGLEEPLEKQIDQHRPQSIKLLKQAVDINSGTMNFVGVKHVGMLVCCLRLNLMTLVWILNGLRVRPSAERAICRPAI
jgi:hypothetical protein